MKGLESPYSIPRELRPSTKSLDSDDKRHTFIKIELSAEKTILRFISKSKFNRDVRSKYRVFYKQPQDKTNPTVLLE